MDQLLRVVMGADGQLVVGRTQPGRGAWLHRGSPGCLAQAVRRGAFARALRTPVPEGAVARLVACLEAERAGSSPDSQAPASASSCGGQSAQGGERRAEPDGMPDVRGWKAGDGSGEVGRVPPPSGTRR